jgi:hypothetical protein
MYATLYYLTNIKKIVHEIPTSNIKSLCSKLYTMSHIMIPPIFHKEGETNHISIVLFLLEHMVLDMLQLLTLTEFQTLNPELSAVWFQKTAASWGEESMKDCMTKWSFVTARSDNWWNRQGSAPNNYWCWSISVTSWL